jgi:hypothetical protein
MLRKVNEWERGSFNKGLAKKYIFPQRRKAAKHTETSFKPAKHEGGYIGCKIMFFCNL